MTARSTPHSLALTAALCIGAFAAPAPTHAQAQAQPDACNARARIPWTAAGEGFFAEAIVAGPSCAKAVVVFVARRPGGLAGRLLDERRVLPGSTAVGVDIRPTAEVPTLAGARDAAAMTAALPGWLAERLRAQAVLPEPDDLAARRAAGETRGDCSARVVLPWPGAGAGYAVEAFAEGTDCNNAVLAMVVRAPDGRPLYGHAMSAFGYNVYHLPKEVTTKDEMAAALRDWMHPGNATTEGLRPWPAGTAEREIVIGPPGGLSYSIDTGNKFTQLTWNALRAAKRPAFGFKVSPETGVTVVLLPDGRVIEAAAVWSN